MIHSKSPTKQDAYTFPPTSAPSVASEGKQAQTARRRNLRDRGQETRVLSVVRPPGTRQRDRAATALLQTVLPAARLRAAPSAQGLEPARRRCRAVRRRVGLAGRPTLQRALRGGGRGYGGQRWCVRRGTGGDVHLIGRVDQVRRTLAVANLPHGITAVAFPAACCLVLLMLPTDNERFDVHSCYSSVRWLQCDRPVTLRPCSAR